MRCFKNRQWPASPKRRHVAPRCQYSSRWPRSWNQHGANLPTERDGPFLQLVGFFPKFLGWNVPKKCALRFPPIFFWNPQRSDSDKMEVDNLREITTYGCTHDDHDVYAVFFISMHVCKFWDFTDRWVRMRCLHDRSHEVGKNALLTSNICTSSSFRSWSSISTALILIYTAPKMNEWQWKNNHYHLKNLKMYISPLKTDDFPAIAMLVFGV